MSRARVAVHLRRRRPEYSSRLFRQEAVPVPVVRPRYDVEAHGAPAAEARQNAAAAGSTRRRRHHRHPGRGSRRRRSSASTALGDQRVALSSTTARHGMPGSRRRARRVPTMRRAWRQALLALPRHRRQARRRQALLAPLWQRRTTFGQTCSKTETAARTIPGAQGTNFGTTK